MRRQSMHKRTPEHVVETITLRSLSQRERDRVRGKSIIIPLTLTLSPENHGGEGSCSDVPRACPKPYRHSTLTPMCRIYEGNTRLGRLRLDATDDEEAAEA
jgi:hypothetical protein